MAEQVKTSSVEPQHRQSLREVSWDDINEPGASDAARTATCAILTRI